MASLEIFEEALVIRGEAVDRLANSFNLSAHRLGAYHITLVTKAELCTLATEQISNLRDSWSDPTLLSAGLGSNPHKTLSFVIIICPALQQLRKLVRLPPKDLYILLSGNDQSSISKGIETLDTVSTDIELLDQLAYTLQLQGKYALFEDFSTKLVSAAPKSVKGFVRLADAAYLLSKFKLAMLSYACAIERLDSADIASNKARKHCMRKLHACAAHTEWGSVLQEQELDQIPTTLRHLLLKPWSQELRESIRDADFTPTLCVDSRERLFTPRSSFQEFFKLPRFFRWLVPFSIAIMSTPRNAEDIVALASQELGIKHILTLMDESRLHPSWFKVRHRKIRNSHIPIPNYHPPTLEQMDLIIRLISDPENQPILIHCGAGKGRAGTVAACYLAAYGFRTPETAISNQEPAMSSSDAISTLRSLRPGSLETKEQERFVGTWVSAIWKRRSILPRMDVWEPPPCPLEVVEGRLDPNKDNLFVLVGLPGSGKSSFSAALKARNPSGWRIISQDDSGSKSLCETWMSSDPNKASTRNKPVRVILDRCNTNPTARQYWHSLASNWVTKAVCIWFDYPEDLCISRAQSRIGHPTLPPGPRVRTAMKQMKEQFVAPSSEKERYFSAIVKVKSFAAADELIKRLSPPSSVGLFKYPRTPHLINLGAVGEDDVITSRSSLFTLPSSTDRVGSSINVVITEKTDGANLGFSLNENRELLVQNRSHYVNPSSHAQFKHLGTWVEKHREELYSVLDRDNEHFPERFVLFGEWVYATHSIHYERLPDLFMAFDLYDRSTESWADRQTLLASLEGTAIQPVRAVYEGQSIPSDEELIQMTQQQSHFYDGKVEGVYVYVEQHGRVVQRGKVVRGDFISGNDHWTHGKLQMNGLQDGYTL